MKVTLRIWLTALILQPIIFCFFLFWAAVFIIPFEIAGSIPGILVFGFVLKGLSITKMRLEVKWGILLLFGILLALGCSYIFVGGFNGATFVSDEDYLLLIPAPLAAFLSIIINGSLVNAYIDTDKAESEALSQ